ncbi:MAG: hypothetical protein ACLFQ8_02630 [Candidatus Aenigmatarchaeota archaeon]
MKRDKTAVMIAFLVISTALMGFVAAAEDSGYNADVEVLNSDCSSTPNRTEITERNSTENGVVFHGVFQTPNPCHTVNVSSLEKDGETYTLDLTANSEEGMCVQCVGAVTYEVNFTAEESGELEVMHDGKRVDTIEFEVEGTNTGTSGKNLFEVASDWFSSVFGF